MTVHTCINSFHVYTPSNDELIINPASDRRVFIDLGLLFPTPPLPAKSNNKQDPNPTFSFDAIIETGTSKLLHHGFLAHDPGVIRP